MFLAETNGLLRTEGLDLRNMTEAVGAASIAGSYRHWARLAPAQAEALLEKAEEWSRRASALLALAVGAGGLD